MSSSKSSKYTRKFNPGVRGLITGGGDKVTGALRHSFRYWHREIIAAGLRILKKSRGHDGAHGVAADVLAAGVAAAVAKKTRHRAQGADLESISQHIPGVVAPAAAALASVISQHRDSLHRRFLP